MVPNMKTLISFAIPYGTAEQIILICRLTQSKKCDFYFAHKINSLSLSILVVHLTVRDGGNVDIAWSIYRPCATGIANKSAIPYRDNLRKRSALKITDTELKLMAAAAIIGDSRMPKNGYRIPAATGTPSAL